MRLPMLLYALTIFVSAFLLFLVQPVMAKQILPWFGGSAAVWTTCLVFFQTTLLLGYAYADLIVRRLSSRSQVIVHVALLRGQLRGPAHRSRRAMEAARHRESVVHDPRVAGGDRRAALFVAVDDEPPGPGLVCAKFPRPQPVSPVCVVEPRVDARAGRLPVRARTVGCDAHAVLRLVGGVRAVRCALHRAAGGTACALPPLPTMDSPTAKRRNPA